MNRILQSILLAALVVVPGAFSQDFIGGISILQGPGGGSGGGTTITVEDEGGAVAGGPHSVMNFTGTGVTASDAGGGQVDITIPGGAVAASPVSFSVSQLAATAQAIPAGVGEAAITQVTLDNVRFSVGGGFAGSVFTAPQDGTYSFTGRVTYTAVTDPFSGSSALVKNYNPAVGIQGTEQWYGGTIGFGNSTGSPADSTVSALISLVAGDTVELFTQHTAAGPLGLQVEGVGVSFEGAGVRLEGHLISSAGALTGKTFVPVVESEKLIGAPLYTAGSGSGTVSGSLNLATAGIPRTIPAGATHAVIRAALDMNVSAGQVEYHVSVVENGQPANTAVPIAWGNATATGFGEGSITDTGVAIVALNPAAAPNHIDYHLIDTGLGGTRSLIRLFMSIDGWLIDDAGGAGSSEFVEETFTPTAAQTIFVTAVGRLAGDSSAFACVNQLCGYREIVDWTFVGNTFTWLDPFVFDTSDELTLKYQTN